MHLLLGKHMRFRDKDSLGYLLVSILNYNNGNKLVEDNSFVPIRAASELKAN